jgi:hypothetical protein
MKDWQLFCILASIYAAPHFGERYARICSMLATILAVAYYYDGA